MVFDMFADEEKSLVCTAILQELQERTTRRQRVCIVPDDVVADSNQFSFALLQSRPSHKFLSRP